MRRFARPHPRALLWAGGLWLAAAGFLSAQPNPMPAAPASPPPPAAPLLPTEFLGWTNAFRLQNDRLEAVVVPAIGRLVHFAPLHGTNSLRLDPALHGTLPPENDPFFNIGGDWMWPVAQSRWPMLDPHGRHWPPPLVLSDRPWSCSAWTDAAGAQCIQLSRDYGEPLNVQVSRLFRLEPEANALVVQQRIERTAPSDIPVVLWNISQVADTRYIALPTGPDSRFDGGIQALIGGKPSRHIETCGDAAVYHVAEGVETKLGSDSARAWIAAARDGQALFEFVANPPGGDYPDGGCVVELFSNQAYGYSEIETLGPELPLAPGTVVENTLRYSLATLKDDTGPCGFADAMRALAGEK